MASCDRFRDFPSPADLLMSLGRHVRIERLDISQLPNPSTWTVVTEVISLDFFT